MRLVSQDGTIDVPYDISALGLGEHCASHVIYVRSKLIDDKPCVFADYSTKEKALKAMEMLREEYDYVRTFETICNGSSNYPNLPSYIFQFPKDEEIEV